MSDLPEVSVALCTRNGESYVAEQINSVLAQTRRVDQIIVSDDASTDGSMDIIRGVLEVAEDVDVRLIQNDVALGVTKNFQQAIEATTGKFVFLCDQDDRWRSDRVEATLSLLDGNPGARLLFSDARLIDGAGEATGATLFQNLEVSAQAIDAVNEGEAFSLFLKRNIATGATIAFRRELLQDALPFPPEWVHDEWLAVLAAARAGVRADNRPLIDYRQHGSNQIGVAEPTLRRKISRVMEPRGSRNRDLADRARILLDRLRFIGSEEGVLAQAQRKLSMEAFRSGLPVSRWRRIVPVLLRALSGDYRRYCSQGNFDVLRDLIQPAQ